jgi:hypothetical protein
MGKINLDITSGRVTGSLVIETGILSTSWTTVHPKAFGAEGGQVASWGEATAHLYGGGTSPVLSLHGVTKATQPGQTGNGEMFQPDAAIPPGEVSWKCI